MHTHAEPDPHDPLAPRPDDPRIGWWWRARLYDRHRGGARAQGPVFVALAMLLVGLAALAVVAMLGAW